MRRSFQRAAGDRGGFFALRQHLKERPRRRRAACVSGGRVAQHGAQGVEIERLIYIERDGGERHPQAQLVGAGQRLLTDARRAHGDAGEEIGRLGGGAALAEQVVAAVAGGAKHHVVRRQRREGVRDGGGGNVGRI